MMLLHQLGIKAVIATPTTNARRTRNILDQKEPIVSSNRSDCRVNDATKNAATNPNTRVNPVR